MAFDWKRLERQDAHKMWRALMTVGVAAAALGLVGVIWGAAGSQSDRLIDGVIQLSVGLVVVGLATRLRGRPKRDQQ